MNGIFCSGNTTANGIKNVTVVFEGSKFEVEMKAAVSQDGKSIIGSFPFWGTAEQVHAYAKIDGIRNKHIFKVYFVKCWERVKASVDQKPFLKTWVNYDEGVNEPVSIRIEWNRNALERSYWNLI